MPAVGAVRTKVTAWLVQTPKNGAMQQAAVFCTFSDTPMARIQFTDFDDAVFGTALVCPPPLHPGAHTDNVQLLQLASLARFRFFEALGYRETNVEGVQIFVGDQAVQYKSEAFPDQSVEVQMAVRDIASKGFDLIYRLVDAQTGRLISLGKIGIVSVNRQTKRPCALPDVFKAKLLDLEPLAIANA